MRRLALLSFLALGASGLKLTIEPSPVLQHHGYTLFWKFEDGDPESFSFGGQFHGNLTLPTAPNIHTSDGNNNMFQFDEHATPGPNNYPIVAVDFTVEPPKILASVEVIVTPNPDNSTGSTSGQGLNQQTSPSLTQSLEVTTTTVFAPTGTAATNAPDSASSPSSNLSTVDNDSSKRRHVAIIAGAVVGSVAVLAILVAVLLYRRRKPTAPSFEFYRDLMVQRRESSIAESVETTNRSFGAGSEGGHMYDPEKAMVPRNMV